jgi:hypothetical protein
VKSCEETIRILEAFDLTRSYRAAAQLAGCDHHTVARCVAARDAGRMTAEPAARDHLIVRSGRRSRSGWSAAVAECAATSPMTG